MVTVTQFRKKLDKGRFGNERLNCHMSGWCNNTDTPNAVNRNSSQCLIAHTLDSGIKRPVISVISRSLGTFNVRLPPTANSSSIACSGRIDWSDQLDTHSYCKIRN